MSHLLKNDLEDFEQAVAKLVTEDDEPVDNIFAAKQQRLLVEPLYGAWTPPPNEERLDEPRLFLADANVGVFFSPYRPPIVPDCFVSLDVPTPPDWDLHEHRSYFVWDLGKPPDAVVELISDRRGGELTRKLREYARMDISYYVVFDPLGIWRAELQGATLRVYERGFGRRYRRRTDYRLPEIGLSLKLWQGSYEGFEAEWLRWCNADGDLLPNSYETRAASKALVAEAQEHATEAEERATEAEERATEAEERTVRLAAKLRELGVDPE